MAALIEHLDVGQFEHTREDSPLANLPKWAFGQLSNPTNTGPHFAFALVPTRPGRDVGPPTS